MTFELTKDQKNVIHKFIEFIEDKDEKFMIIQGSAGTGKSTLISYMADVVKKHYEVYAMLLKTHKRESEFEFVLTATTNKAAKVVSDITKREAYTIHSLLRVKPVPDFNTGYVKLRKNKDYTLIYNSLIIIDEGSMMNDELFDILDETCIDCKIVIMGDHYQLAPVKQKHSIMSTLQAPKAELSKVMRHSGNILHTASLFREVVRSEKFVDIPNHPEIQKVDGATFQQKINEAFTDEDYHINSAKILAWTNNRVLDYSKYVRSLRKLPEQFTEGETVFTNKPIIHASSMRSTDSAVMITEVGKEYTVKGVKGNMLEIDNRIKAFHPHSFEEVKLLLKRLAKLKEWQTYYTIKEQWLDLRSPFSCTVHKAQGSTYDSVFIDLADIGRCTIASDVARMLYVAISRASKQIYLYGELPERYKEE